MATLVLTAVGTALGGPLGGAIGSLIGQSFDQQLFGSARRGPRLGDLAVQTSTYGTQIPRIYGTMRVAGSVIWATDLAESTTQTGAKGQPETTVYSYSVSLAVALSSRAAGAIGRIWADGKLLRGAAGDFKVSTGFRFYPGSESQAIDPLIGSIEGIGDTPAYRGLAVAVFEDLELAEYGNRIPFLTFEVEADAAAQPLAAILADASGGIVQSDAANAIDGYAAHGASIKAAVEPLVQRFGLELFDDGSQLRPATAGPAIAVADDDLGNSADGKAADRQERTQAAARSLPAALTLAYYDASRDYQTAQMRATVGESSGAEENAELAVVMSAQAARGLVESELARRWARRDQLTLRLPPRCLAIEPGTTVELASSPSLWTVEQCVIEALVAVVELRPAWQAAGAIAGDPGRALGSPDIVQGEIIMALFDLPDLAVDEEPVPALHLAAASSTAGWRPVPIEMTAGGATSGGQTAARKSVLGSAVAALAAGQPHLIDLANSVEVELVDPTQWLESCDDQALVMGGNLAALGSELVQFGQAEPTGPGRFRLSRLLRGRRGTEWAMGGHAADEAFAVLEPGLLRRINLPSALRGTIVEVRSARPGDTGLPISALANGEALRPPSPVHLEAWQTAAGDVEARWVRRSRHGWAWLDDMDAPLGEAQELYRVTLDGTGGSIQVETGASALVIDAAEVAAAGTGNAILSVQQLGDLAASRATQISITLV
jgi:hypothetical protein